MIDYLSLTPAAIDALGWTLVHAAWQGAAIAIVLAAVLRFAALSPRARYALACGALAAMLAAPAITFVMLIDSTPGARPDVAARRAAIRADATLADPLGPTTTAAVVNVPIPSARRSTPGTGAGVAAPRAEAGVATRLGEPSAMAASPTGVTLVTRLRRELDRALPTLVTLWMIGLLVGVVRVGGGVVRAQHLRSHGTRPLPPEWMRSVERLARRFGVTRRIAARESSSVDSPSVIGWLRPVLLVPAAALGGLSPQQLEAVLAHELAHIRRHDYLVNLAQLVAETVLFYHPAVWYVSQRVRVEREHCCDDLAVAACGDAVTYASALAELERLRLTWAPALALTATRGPLLRRIERVLDAPAREGAPAGGALSMLAACVLAFSVGLLAWNPTTENNTTSTSTATPHNPTTENNPALIGHGAAVSDAAPQARPTAGRRDAGRAADAGIDARRGVHTVAGGRRDCPASGNRRVARQPRGRASRSTCARRS